MWAESTSPRDEPVRRRARHGARPDTAAAIFLVLGWCVVLAWCVLAQPARAFERMAHLQPSAGASSPVTPEAEARAHPENLAAKARQDAFDARIQRRNLRALASLCRGCEPRPGAEARSPQFDRGAGAGVTAESVYSRPFGFDPAEAYTD